MQVPVELKKKYLERRRQDIELLISSLEVNDFEPAVKIGHQVKGNALTFDFPQMGPIGSALEKAGKSRDKESMKNLIQKMASEIQMASLSFH